MRVIAGTAGGARLGRVPAGTRPLSDRAREGLFSSLGEAVPGARWVDLFAGTGAVGIEALSRGAASCAFVDRSPAAIRTIRENLVRTGLTDRARVVRSDAERFLGRDTGPVDVAFLDPPHSLSSRRLGGLIERTRVRLAGGGIVVVTRARRDSTDVIPVHFEAVRPLAYGDTRILICREAP